MCYFDYGQYFSTIYVKESLWNDPWSSWESLIDPASFLLI